MSSSTRIEGYVSIRPPLKWKQFKDSAMYTDTASKNRYCPDAVFEISESSENTEDGVLLRRVATGISENSCETNGGTLVSDLEDVIKANPAHDFSGRFDCFDTDYGTVWRVRVKDNKVIREEPRLVWPSDED